MEAPLFFSIIIPAHNEEKCIERTLSYIQKIDYPSGSFEAIIIENGSTDATYAKAKPFENNTIKVFSISQKGVSVARNAGVARHNKNSQWTIFMDADTFFEPGFLKELDTFLKRERASSYSVGTTMIEPFPNRLGARLWFRFYDFGHWLTKTSYALFIVRTDLLQKISFDEKLKMGEDLRAIEEARRHGKFFFLRTNSVYTSTRRFDKEGWVKIFFVWIFVAMLPQSIQRRFEYKITR